MMPQRSQILSSNKLGEYNVIITKTKIRSKDLNDPLSLINTAKAEDKEQNRRSLEMAKKNLFLFIGIVRFFRVFFF